MPKTMKIKDMRILENQRYEKIKDFLYLLEIQRISKRFSVSPIMESRFPVSQWDFQAFILNNGIPTISDWWNE